MKPEPSMKLLALVAGLHVGLIAPPAQAQGDTPAAWDPAWWQQTMHAAQEARDRGERQAAEALCARAVPYAEAQAVPALRAYAALLESRQPGSGADMQAKAERLAQLQESRRTATAPASSYMGFAPAQELAHYADLLQQTQRDDEARAMRALAQAYQHSQQAYFHRMQLMQQGKDPRGDC